MHAAHQGRADATMMAVVTTGTGGYDRLDYRRVPRPVPGPGEVLMQVPGASGGVGTALIAEAQAAFQSKQHMGKFVLIPPH